MTTSSRFLLNNTLSNKKWRCRYPLQSLIEIQMKLNQEKRGVFLMQGSENGIDYCEWCSKPQNQWTKSLRHRGFKKSYCTLRCYAAGEYKVSLYFALCSISLLGIGLAFVSFQFLSNPSGFYISVVLFLTAVFIIYSSICAYIPIIGRSERRERESVSS